MTEIFKNKKVFITGITGFKGSWLASYLLKLGANVQGFSRPPNTIPNHFSLLNLDKNTKHIGGDIRWYDELKFCIQEFKPDIVFHLAAQPLVKQSYFDPHYTFDTNIMGTVNILEACKDINSIKAIVLITTDKVYENKNQTNGFSEHDRLGGFDPYSASKACAELVISSYRDSFYSKTKTLIASVRAGNVIGGGDWSEDRLIPDIIKSIVNKQELIIRNPYAIRPWQHVLDCLHGYLLLTKNMLQNNDYYASAWNFGPSKESEITVGKIIEYVNNLWEVNYTAKKSDFHESQILRLDSTKSRTFLNWIPSYDIKTTIEKTIIWYKEFYEHNNIITEQQIEEYIKDNPL